MDQREQRPVVSPFSGEAMSVEEAYRLRSESMRRDEPEMVWDAWTGAIREAERETISIRPSARARGLSSVGTCNTCHAQDEFDVVFPSAHMASVMRLCRACLLDLGSAIVATVGPLERDTREDRRVS